MTHTYYIIESPTLGTLADTERDYDGKLHVRYSIAGARTDNAILFHRFDQAEETLNDLVLNKVRGHKALTIVRTDDFRVHCNECHQWIDNSYGNPKGHDNQCPVWRKWLASH
jgi:hypothetical protein